MSTPNSQLRATGASTGPLRASSLDSGAAIRLAYGGAAFSSLEARNRAIRSAYQTGMTVRAVAQQFGMTSGRVSQILCAFPGHQPNTHARRSAEDLDRLTAKLLEDYEAGLSLTEAAQRNGLSTARVCNLLSERPDYRPRIVRRVSAKTLDKVAVPSWVPPNHHGRYRQIAATNGEEVAASCLRKLKRIEVSQ